MKKKFFTMKLLRSTSDSGDVTWFSKFKLINNKQEVFAAMLYMQFYGATFALLERVLGDDALREYSDITGEKIVRFVEMNLDFGAIYTDILKCYASSDHDTDDLLNCIAAQAKVNDDLSKFNDEIIEHNIRDDIEKIDELFITKYVKPRIDHIIYGL